MKIRIILPIILLFFISAFLVSACVPGQDNSTAQNQFEDISDLELLIEGRIVPQQWVELSFPGSGLVEEIHFLIGDSVKKGDIIAQISGYQQLTATLAASELELLSARQHYDLMQDNHELVKAQALADRLALQQVIETAELDLENLKVKDIEIEIERAKANIVLLENQLEQAENLFDDYEDWLDTSLTKANARVNLANALQQLEEGFALQNFLENRNKELEIEKAEAEISILKEQLAQAQERAIKLQSGPLPEDVVLADQRLTAAQAAVDSARAALDSLRITAPFDGKIFESTVKVGQLAIAGQRAFVFADTSQWLVETNDLTEIDRIGVSIGQSVTVTPDALPDLAIMGKVLHISNYYQENRGDITYKTIISLQQTDPALQWGMTVLINFEEE